MHDVFGCPGRAYLFQLSNVHQNDRTLRFSHGAFAEDKKLAKWRDPAEIAARAWEMPVIITEITEVSHTAWRALVRLESGSAAQADPESPDP